MRNDYSGESRNARQRIGLGRYLEPRGLDLDEFAAQVRDFFVSSQDHFGRLICRDAIAECLGLDMASEKDRDTLWRTIANDAGISRKVRGQWLTGELDPPIEAVKRYLPQLACPRVESKLLTLTDLAAPVRMGISRTLTYIRVFPPNGPANVQSLERSSGKLLECWAKLKRHVHYRTPKGKPRRNLNQHALDLVREEFRDALWLEPQAIAGVKRGVEVEQRDKHPLYWDLLMFKFATFEDISSTNVAKRNPYRWIWDNNHIRHNEIWGN